MNVYDYVKALADEKNLTIKEVEVACGLGNATISKWKTSMPKADVLFKVAQFLGESVEYFLTGNRSIIDPTEEVIINAYRQTNAAGKARIIQIILNEKDDSQSQIHTIYRAASSSEHEEPRIEQRTATDMGKLKNASTVTSEEDL